MLHQVPFVRSASKNPDKPIRKCVSLMCMFPNMSDTDYTDYAKFVIRKEFLDPSTEGDF